MCWKVGKFNPARRLSLEIKGITWQGPPQAKLRYKRVATPMTFSGIMRFEYEYS